CPSEGIWKHGALGHTSPVHGSRVCGRVPARLLRQPSILVCPRAFSLWLAGRVFEWDPYRFFTERQVHQDFCNFPNCTAIGHAPVSSLPGLLRFVAVWSE